LAKHPKNPRQLTRSLVFSRQPTWRPRGSTPADFRARILPALENRDVTDAEETELSGLRSPFEPLGERIMRLGGDGCGCVRALLRR
jgi:hypothetical protein